MIQGYPAIHTWHHEVQHSARGPIATGALIVLICGCGFGLWGGLAPLASAVVASGSFVATGQNKQVQHLEVEFIKELLVREGDIVEANQPLVRSGRYRRTVKAPSSRDPAVPTFGDVGAKSRRDQFRRRNTAFEAAR